MAEEFVVAEKKIFTDIADVIRNAGGIDSSIAVTDLGEKMLSTFGDGTLFGVPWDSGSFTPSEDIISSYDIMYHENKIVIKSLTLYPTFFLWRKVTDSNSSSMPPYSILWLTSKSIRKNKDNVYLVAASSDGSSTTTSNWGDGVGSNISTRKYTVYCTNTHRFIAGETYNWIAFSCY